MSAAKDPTASAHTAKRSLSGLTTRFAVVGGIILIVAGIVLAQVNRSSAAADLKMLAEQNSVALTRAFAGVIWPQHAGFLTAAGRLDVDVLRSHPSTAAINRDIVAMMSGTGVVKVKLFSLDGRVLFSTARREIGEDKSGNSAVRDAAAGSVRSQITHRDQFDAFDGVIVDRDLLSSYIPVRDGGGPVVGVIEVYADITALNERIFASQLYRTLAVGSVFVLIYLLLVTVVWWTDRRITMERSAREKSQHLAQAADEANRLKSQFLANMSHELRTPLNAIIGFADMMKQQIYGPVGSPRYVEYLGDISHSANHLLAIINDVLDMSKIDAGSVALQDKAVDVNGLLNSCARMLDSEAEKRSVDLTVDIPHPLPLIRADELRLRQVVLNLLSNAVKFTDAGGAVVLAGRYCDFGLAITVRDTGIGMAREEIPKVLAPFSQVADSYARNHTGTGLGLAIAKSLIELHEGRLTIASKPGVGTRVRVLLPESRMLEASPRRRRKSVAVS